MVDVSAQGRDEPGRGRRGPRAHGRGDARGDSRAGDAKKGDVIGAARIAGIMAAKKTSELIPLCHPLQLTKVDGRHRRRRGPARPRACAREARCVGPTGVEMEALTAVAVACLTIYDMAKAIDRGMSDRGRAADREARRQVGRLARRRRDLHERHDHGRGGARRACSPPPRRRSARSGSRSRPRIGRVLARDLAALRTQPPFANSAMDGYALRAADAAQPDARR